MMTDAKRNEIKKDIFEMLEYTLSYKDNYKEVSDAFRIVFNYCSDDTLEQIHTDQFEAAEELNSKYK